MKEKKEKKEEKEEKEEKEKRERKVFGIKPVDKIGRSTNSVWHNGSRTFSPRESRRFESWWSHRKKEKKPRSSSG